MGSSNINCVAALIVALIVMFAVLPFTDVSLNSVSELLYIMGVDVPQCLIAEHGKLIA